MTTPKWFQTLSRKAAHQNAFILHFNVRDYVQGGATLEAYLTAALAGREMVVFYNIADGIRFANELTSTGETTEDAFFKMIGREDLTSEARAEKAAQQGGGNDPFAALRAATGQDEQEDENPIDSFRLAAVALPALETALTKGAAVIITDAETILPNDPNLQMAERINLVRVRNWGTNSDIAAGEGLAILVTATAGDLHSTMLQAANRWEQITVPYPNYEDRLAFIEGVEDLGVETDISNEAFAAMTAGLGLVHIEDIMLAAQDEGELTAGMIRNRKREIIDAEYGELLDFVEPSYGWEGIGGLEHVKRFFRRNVEQAIKAGNYRRCPMGVLMTGPAGTGKSVVAVALAKEAGVNVIKLNIGGQIASKWQGEGERNLRKALMAIDTFAPCLVFIDEIDQVLRRNEGGSGGSQQDSRIFQMLMEYMSDTSHRGKVIFLAATNRPKLIDAALRRPGRFDKKVPFFVPNAEERAELFDVFCKRLSLAARSTSAVEHVKATEGWTGAEIEAATVKAVELFEDAAYDGLNISPAEALRLAVSKMRASTQEIERMTTDALQECDDEDLVPEAWRAMWRTVRGEAK